MTNPLKKRQTTLIDIAFSFVIFSLIIAGVFLVFTSGKNEASSNSDDKNSFSPTPTTIDTIDSNYPGIKIVTETSNDSFAPFAIQYPQSLHIEFNEAVSSYISKTKNDYIQTMKEYEEKKGKLHGELNISFETLLHHSGNYSFVIVTNNFTGGAKSFNEIYSFHLNPETGENLLINDVLEHDLEKLEKLAERVKNELVNDVDIKEYLLTDKMNTELLPKWDNFSNFALTNEDIFFYFEQYKFTTGAAGIPIIKIPLEKINPIIADNFKAKEITQTPEGTEDKINQDHDKKIVNSKNNEQTSNLAGDSEKQVPPVKPVALTFDDGPHPEVTRQILDILKKHEAKATFFMLGSRVEYYPDIAKEVQEAGHELGNHSWNHPDLTKVSDERMHNEINNTSIIIEQATGQKATVFRPPYGAANDTVRQQTDLPVILWDVDTLDWQHRDPTQLLTIVKNHTKEGSNILMHDIHQATADALDNVLTYLKSEGYTFVTVSELE